MEGIESEDGSGMSEAPELSVTQSPMGQIPQVPFAQPMALTRSRQSGRGGIPKRAGSASAPETGQARFFKELGRHLRYLDCSIQVTKDETHIAYAALAQQA